MPRHLLLAALLAATSLFPAHGAEIPPTASDSTASQALDALFAAEWERGLQENPVSATFFGDDRFNDRWNDYSLAAIERRQAADREALAKLHAIDRAALAKADRLNYDTFEWQLEQAIAEQRFRTWQRSISHMGGLQTLHEMTEALPLRDAGDYRDWLARMAAIPVLVEQAIDLMGDGVEAGNVQPRVLMQRVPEQIAAQIVEDPAESPFYSAFKDFPEVIPAAEQEALRTEALRTIREQVVPAYRTLQAYFNDEYLPHAREDIAVASLPDGDAYYTFLASFFTTTDLTPEQIHEIGLGEVARIRGEMEEVKAEVGFDGTLAEFFTYLRTDPQFFEKTPEALLRHYRAVAKRIDPELVKVFRDIPRLPYGVRPVPELSAPHSPTAYYLPGTMDGSRSGYYYVNLYKPETRPTWEMVPLSLHEGVPGHHFQFSRAMELADVPMFRRHAPFVAYVEGWGLYAERLGYDMGLYDDPHDRMGQLAYDMWRAVRLVVDTGIHAKGWSREQAIEYFLDNAPKARLDVVNEIDRYIDIPGQALAYKIGQMKISELREKSSRELGGQFDLRGFNDAVLETGAVPLTALERHIDDWIAAQKQLQVSEQPSIPAGDRP